MHLWPKKGHIKVPLADIKPKDKSGSGDHRDAGYGVGYLFGLNPLESLFFGTAAASFGVGYKGRDWGNHLSEFETILKEEIWLHIPKKRYFSKMRHMGG